MTKRQLIEMLETIPGETRRVVIWDPDAQGPMPVTGGMYREEDGMPRYSGAPEQDVSPVDQHDLLAQAIYLYSDNQEC